MTDPLAEKIGINVQGGTVNVQNLNLGIAERQEQVGDRVRILVVAANPLGSSPLKLDHEVKTIQAALKRSRKRDNFVVEYQLAATPSELRRALLDFEPHVLHFSGHGAGEQGLLFVSDESAAAIYRSDSGEVRSHSVDTNEIRFVPAQPLARLLQLCDEHLECVVLTACYSDVQGNAIANSVPITIGMRDVVADNVAIKFSQGFYDAIGAGKSYEKAFEWGKVAIEFDLANNEAGKILILRKKGESISPFISAIPDISPPTISVPPPPRSLSASEYFDRALKKNKNGDKEGAIADYSEAICLNPDFAEAYNDRGSTKAALGDKEGAIADYDEAIRLEPDYVDAFNNRGNAKSELGDKYAAMTDYKEAILRNPYHAEAYNNRGNANYALGDNHKAISDYSQAIYLKPGFACSYYGRGTTKQCLKDQQGAIYDYDKAIYFKPDYAAAYCNRGNAKADIGKKEEAIADFRESARLYKQQGKTSDYEYAQNRMRELGG